MCIALYASRPLSPGLRNIRYRERYPLLGPVFHRLDRTSLPGASFDHLVDAGEQRLARPFCAVVEPGEGHDDAQHKRQLPFEGPPLH